MGKLYFPSFIFPKTITAHQSSHSFMNGTHQSYKNLTIMQPKFTRRSLVYFFSRLSMLTLVMALTTLVSFSQNAGKGNQQLNADRQARTAQKLKIEKFGKTSIGPVAATNDAGITPTRNAGNIVARTEAVCQTFTGSLAAGDATMPARLFRGGVNLSSCAANPAFPGTSAVSPFFDTYTYTNTTGLTQCGTFALTTNDVVNANIELGVWNGSFDPNNQATNYITDPGSSTGTPILAPLTCNATIAAGQTVVIAVWSANASGTAAGTASDYTVTVSFPICSSAPCAGTPTPGNTLSSAATVCPGINFTLTTQNATSGSGVTYQWQSAPTSAGPFNDIAGATGSALTTTQAVATCYRVRVICGSAGGGTAFSTPVCVALTPPSGCYCTPPGSDCTDSDIITRVRISTMDNASTCGTGPPAGYTNYTSTVAAPIVYAGAGNPLTVDVATVFSEFVAAWIDYNQNGLFEASEYTNLGNNSAGGTLTANVNIPASALTGVTRMRVRVRFATVLGTGDPCTGYTFGETEDYSVNIQPCVPVTITSSPANSSTVCGGNATFTVATSGTLPTYRWEYRVNASSPWLFVPATAPYSGILTPTLTISGATAALNGYQYRATVAGGCSGTDFSAAATLTITPIVPIVNPASASICLGQIQQLTLTNTVSAPTTVTFNATGLPIAIPDANTTGITATIPVAGIPAGAVITEMKVKFSVPAHTWAGDLCAVIKSPAGAILNLDYFISSTGVGPTIGTGIQNTALSSLGGPLLSSAASPWTGTFRADAVTTIVAGNPPSGPTGFTPTTAVWTPFTTAVNPNGNYTFAIFDAFGGDFGSLTAASIEVTYVAPVFAQGTWTGPAGTMFTDAAATVAYTGTPATTIYVKPTVSSNYTVSYTTPAPCTSAVTTVPVTVSTPIVVTTAPANKTACDGATGTQFTIATTGGPISYQWQVSTDGGLTYSNIAGQTTSTLTLGAVNLAMNNNRYRVVMTAGGCAGVTSASAILTVTPLPVVTLTSPDLLITPGQTTTVTATSVPAAATPSSYVWTLNGNVIPGANTSTVTVNIDGIGTYQATVASSNGCSNVSNTLVIGSEASDRLWIWPNPTNGRFEVRLYYSGATAEKRVVTIYNQLGQVITSKQFNLNSGTVPYLSMQFDLRNVPAGTYAVKVADHITGKVKSGLVVIQ
jgi:hypothetical protein